MSNLLTRTWKVVASHEGNLWGIEGTDLVSCRAGAEPDSLLPGNGVCLSDEYGQFRTFSLQARLDLLYTRWLKVIRMHTINIICTYICIIVTQGLLYIFNSGVPLVKENLFPTLHCNSILGKLTIFIYRTNQPASLSCTEAGSSTRSRTSRASACTSMMETATAMTRRTRKVPSSRCGRTR